MGRVLVNRYGSGTLENIYKTKQKRDYISQVYDILDASLLSKGYFNFVDLPGNVDDGRALVNRVASVYIDDGRAIINRVTGEEWEHGDQRSVASRMANNPPLGAGGGATQGGGQLPVVQYRSINSRLANGPTTGAPAGATDGRGFVNKTNQSNRLGNQPTPSTGGGVVDQRSVSSRSNSNRMAGGSLPPQMNNGIDDLRAITSRANTSNSNRMGGMEPGRGFINRMANEDGYEFGDQRAVVSRISGGGIEEGYEEGDARALANRMSNQPIQGTPLSATDGRGFINRGTSTNNRVSGTNTGGSTEGNGLLPVVQQRSIVSRMSGGGIEDGYEAGDGRAIINRLGNQLVGTISTINDLRSLVSRANSNRELPPIGGPREARALVNRTSNPGAATAPARNLVSRVGSPPPSSGGNGGGPLDGRALVNRGVSSRLIDPMTGKPIQSSTNSELPPYAGPRELRALTSRTIDPMTNLPPGVNDARNLVSKNTTNTNRVSGDGGIEDGYEQGDQRSIVSRVINPMTGKPAESTDGRAIINRGTVSSNRELPPYAGPKEARALANRLGEPPVTGSGNGGVNDARALVNRTNTNRLINPMTGQPAQSTYGQPIYTNSELPTIGGPKELRSLVSRTSNPGAATAPGRALVNRTSNEPLSGTDGGATEGGGTLPTTQARSLVSRLANPNTGGSTEGNGQLPVVQFRSVNSRLANPGVGGSTEGNGLLPVVQQRSVASRLGDSPVIGSGGNVLDARALVNRANSSRMAADGRGFVNRFSEPTLGGPLEFRSVNSRMAAGPTPVVGNVLDARALANRGETSNSNRMGGMEPGRGFINRMSAEPATVNRIKLTAGKNVIKFAADGAFMRRDMPVDLEVLDSKGNALYTEVSNYQDAQGYYYAIIYVYDITPPGTGTVCFVGYASYDADGNALPQTEKENLIWVAKADINPIERNNCDIVFDQAPTAEISQILIPYQFNLGTYALNSRLVTQSIDGLTIIKSDNIGYDFPSIKSVDIQDQASKDNTYNYFGESITTNTTELNIRKENPDITNGFVFSEFSRYNTIIYDAGGRLKKDMEGSIFSFAQNSPYTSSYVFTPSYTSSILTPTTDPVHQLDTYKSKIVYVINDKYAILESSPSVEVLNTRVANKSFIYDHTFKKVKNVTGSFSYPTSSLNVIKSQNLSSSFIQFTLSDIQPVVGDVYRIKTFVKEAGANTEFKQLNDHIVTPPEFLIDSDKPNQAAYAKNKSDSFVYGEFTDISIANDYWRGFGIESDGYIYQYNSNTTSSNLLANSIVLTSNNSIRKGITSRYYQSYTPNQPFSLSFYCTLDPGCELEVYMGSTPLKSSALGIQGPKAFFETRNTDKTKKNAYTKLGKFIGKISNISGSVAKAYDNVTFDFFADEDGFGRPVLFLNTDNVESKNAYISSVSITPLDLVGYTPSILQFAAPVPDSIWILQDDDSSLTQSIDVKIEYFNYEGKQSEFTTYIPNVQLNLVVDIPGICSSERSTFNDHCPLYYEITSSGTTNTAVGSLGVTKDPQAHYKAYTDKGGVANLYYWPTYSLNDDNGYHWNIINFGVGTNYRSQSLAWTTSSNTIDTLWRRFDPIMPIYTEAMPGYNPFPAMYSASLTTGFSKGDDNQLFWKNNGAAIQTIDIVKLIDDVPYSSSYELRQTQASVNSLNTYLNRTRLYFPTTDEIYPYGFNENGGIYNVKFNLKIFPSGSNSPGFTISDYPSNSTVLNGVPYVDGVYSGVNNQLLNWSNYAVNIGNRYSPEPGAKLMVYIHDVRTPLLTGSIWERGTAGLQPPLNNIVTIGNGYSTAPTLRYYDSGSGAYIETYDIVLVQYGDRAQLTFDASGIELSYDTNDNLLLKHTSGSLNKPAVWGGVISDIEWCKIGVTTDPRFIMPINFNQTIAQRPKSTPSRGGGIIIVGGGGGGIDVPTEES